VTRYIGSSVKRREDRRFLTGDAAFIDDLTLPRMCYAAFLRSPHAHARIGRIRAEAARAAPGVVGVFTFEDLGSWMKPLPQFGAPPPSLAAAVHFEMREALQSPLARDKVHYVGQPVAMIVAETGAQAEDALEAIQVEWEPLPAVTDMSRAVAPGADLVHDTWGSNVAVSFAVAVGDAARAFAAADVVVRETFSIGRSAGVALEPRGVIAEWDARGATLTAWNSTQVPHFVQQGLVTALGLPHHKIRVIAPDVGGGFGTKGAGYAEDLLVPVAAIRLKRPVKWIESRRESFIATTHARDQSHEIALAADRDGTILAVSDRIRFDVGAYNVWGIVVPYNTVAHLLGPYRVRNLAVEVEAVVTNKTPNTPYRGAGRPESAFAMDRAVDLLARELRLDPGEIRAKNYIATTEMPYDVGINYRDGQPLVYDGGDFPALLAAAVRASDYDTVRKQQTELREVGVFRGIGVSGYVEGTAIGPFEGASVRLDGAGRVVVATGAAASGQGHETTLAQIAADTVGVPIDWVTIYGGDTGRVAFGIGTFASRTAVTAGTSVLEACRELRARIANTAAALLEAAPQDIEIEDGHVFVRGTPSRAVPLTRVVQASIPTFGNPGVGSPDFEVRAYAHVPTVTYASGVHVAVVDVDVDTGRVRLLRYVVAHDCGRVINPLIVDGQIHGGVAQGIGGALLEQVVHDDSGQLLTGTLMDYAVPTAVDVPFIDVIHFEQISPGNPLGAKGMGEGGAISPPAAIANAIEDALAPLGVRITKVPIRTGELRLLIARASHTSAGLDA
jgi:carbon-monoxide dehydrogenase large subunit